MSSTLSIMSCAVDYFGATAEWSPSARIILGSSEAVRAVLSKRPERGRNRKSAVPLGRRRMGRDGNPRETGGRPICRRTGCRVRLAGPAVGTESRAQVGNLHPRRIGIRASCPTSRSDWRERSGFRFVRFSSRPRIALRRRKWRTPCNRPGTSTVPSPSLPHTFRRLQCCSWTTSSVRAGPSPWRRGCCARTVAAESGRSRSRR